MLFKLVIGTAIAVSLLVFALIVGGCIVDTCKDFLEGRE